MKQIGRDRRLWGVAVLAVGTATGVTVGAVIAGAVSAAPAPPGELTAAECGGFLSTGEVTYLPDAVSTDTPNTLIDRYLKHRVAEQNALSTEITVQTYQSATTWTADIRTTNDRPAARITLEHADGLGWRFTSIQECGA
jgi:hypothetical protein